MDTIAFTNARVITGTGELFPGTVVIEGSRIAGVGKDLPRKPEWQIIDLHGAYLAPGLIDLHLHGALGHDFTQAGPAEIERILKYHQAGGSTSILATIVCAPMEELTAARLRLARFRETRADSGLLGIHLEGPYISPDRVGALNKKWIRSFNQEEFGKLAQAPVRTVTIAPERVPCSRLSSFKDISFSLGHTNADYETTRQAIAEGIHYTTHFPNALPSLHHRRPGAALALLEAEEVYLELIADGVHICPEMLKFLYKVKGPERIILVSDAAPLLGSSPGKHALWGRRATLTEDRVCFEDGTLAGSGISLLEAVRRMIGFTGCKPCEAFLMAASNPAKRINIQDRKGEISPDRDADLLILGQDLELVRVMVRGKFLT